MRGLQDKQTSMWAFVSIEERIPIEHPLRRIKKLADERLVKLSGVFNRMHSQVGRPSIAPERILKSLLLMALYSARSWHAWRPWRSFLRPIGSTGCQNSRVLTSFFLVTCFFQHFV